MSATAAARTWRRALWTLCVAASACAGAHAQGLDTPPLPAAPRPLQIDVPTQHALPNGLRVVVAPRRGVQLVTAQLLVLGGSEVDPRERSGLAAMTAAMLVKGTSVHTATALARAAESLGGSLDSHAGWHRSDVTITVAVPQLDRALALVAETVRQPTFARDEWERLRAQALDDLKVAYAHPETLAAAAAMREAFGETAYGRAPEGTPASLARITREALADLHRRLYRPGNAVLLLSGDLDPETGWRLARKHFGSWAAPARTGDDTPALAAPAMPQRPASCVVIDMPGSGQAAVAMVVPTPALGADRATAAVVNAVLGGGYSSRLNQDIRIQRGLSYSAGSLLEDRRGAGILRVMVQTKNDSAAQVLALIHGALDRLADTPVGPDELAARKAALIGDVGRGIETTAGLGASVQSLIVAGRPLSELGTRIDAIAGVTAADVHAYAQAHFTADHRATAIAGEYSHFSEALSESAPHAAIVPLRDYLSGSRTTDRSR